MIKSRVILAGALLAVAGAASAEITVTPAIVWDYDFRGISQTAGDPALQLGVNYAHDSGFYAGVWGSNIDFGPGGPDIELDFYTGFSGGDAEESFGYDIGAIYYTYVSESAFDFPEIYAGISKKWFAAKLWYTWDFGGTSQDAYYLEGNGTFPIGESGFSALAHIGWSDGGYWDDFYGDGYFDWAVGVSKAFGPFTATVKYIDGSDLPDGDDLGLPSGLSDVFSTDGKVWIGFQTTLPWKSE
jgi:uncharacterized protein (TIGR02001 family)